MLSDIEIAQSVTPRRITEIARAAGIPEEYLEQYGGSKAKVDYNLLRDKPREAGKLVLVTAINPTPAGEGKTTTTVGLADAMRRIGKNALVALREPSLGPVFGIKGGAAGGGYAQVIPMEDINLHFTGDFHAIGAANNLLAAMIDNHIKQGNALGFDVRKIAWKRVVDMNDRQLRSIVDGLGGPAHGVPREDGFDITVASEVMAVFCLATDVSDLKSRLARIVVGYTAADTPITAGELHAEGAMCALLKDALKPNLVQTLEGTPAFVHGGPFANIAHGCNSVMATKFALKFADYVVTEAGFGSELGAEKFIDIKCRRAGIAPDAAVLVSTIRSLKYNGGADKESIASPDLAALQRGIVNLGGHIEILQNFGLNPVVALNRFSFDSDEEIAFVRDYCKQRGVQMAICENFAKGGEGALELARLVVDECERAKELKFAYELSDDTASKIEKIATKIYGASEVVFESEAQKALQHIKALGLERLNVCIAKTQYSFSDDAKALGRARGFKLSVKDLQIRTGAGFIVAVCGKIMLMPGLPKVPNALNMKITGDGVISGLA